MSEIISLNEAVDRLYGGARNFEEVYILANQDPNVVLNLLNNLHNERGEISDERSELLAEKIRFDFGQATEDDVAKKFLAVLIREVTV